MAETTYTYSIVNDTLNGVVDGASLKLAIEASGSGVSVQVERIDTGIGNEDDLDVVMKDSLSAGEKTTLDGIVAAHDGVAQEDAEEVIVKPRLDKGALVINGAHTGVSLSIGQWTKLDYTLSEDLHMQGCLCNFVGFKLDDYVFTSLIHPGGDGTLAASASANDTSVTVGTGLGVYYDPDNGCKHIEFWKGDFTELFEVRKVTGVSGDVVSFTPGLAAARDTTVETRARCSSFSSVEGPDGIDGGIRIFGSDSVIIYDSTKLSTKISKGMVLTSVIRTNAVTAGTREFSPNYLFRRP